MFLNKYVVEIQNLAVALREAFVRLEGNSDNVALHDYRIVVRRIRSLIGPLRKLPENQALREAAADVGRLTTPARDMEVLIAELQQRGYPEQAEQRRSALQDEYRKIVQSPELQCLFIELELWPAAIARSRLGSEPRELKRIINKALKRQLKKLQAGVADAGFDRHELRIIVKRSRYITDAFPQLSPLSTKAATALKKTQAALGTWHDHYQWGLRAAQEADLQPLLEPWAKLEKKELAAAEKALKKLAVALSGKPAKQ